MNGKTEIWESVEEFRQKHLGDLGKVPVDVLTVIEVRLRLDVIPFDRLFEKYSVDAAVMPDFSGIYVDKRSYRFLEGQPPWLFNRLRFSLAHELGHILLHREKAGDLSFKTLEDYWAWMRRYNESRYEKGSVLDIDT
jgi:Zn-dependent peptidase ImmA (M78 family)